MNKPSITKINNPPLLRAARFLDAFGKLKISKNKLLYLDIDDAYIISLFPMLCDQKITMPDYFNDSVGAHVSVVYPEESPILDQQDFGKEYHFKITELARAELNKKIYYVLLVDSPMLGQLRMKYGLSETLYFKKYAIGFHITIGVQSIN